MLFSHGSQGHAACGILPFVVITRYRERLHQCSLSVVAGWWGTCRQRIHRPAVGFPPTSYADAVSVISTKSPDSIGWRNGD